MAHVLYTCFCKSTFIKIRPQEIAVFIVLYVPFQAKSAELSSWDRDCPQGLECLSSWDRDCPRGLECLLSGPVR